MTNGENILSAFWNATIRRCKNKDFIYIEVEQNDKWIADFDMEWWNAEYKEPTTKNDLSSELVKNSKKLEKDFGELDCISRADAIKAMQDKSKKLTNEDTINGLCGAVAILFDMPSVTPQEPTIKALGEELRKTRKGIADEKVLIGYNMAVAICNKHLGESEE